MKISSLNQKINRPHLATILIFFVLLLVGLLSLTPQKPAPLSSRAQSQGTCYHNTPTYPDCSRGGQIGSDCTVEGPDPLYMQSHYCDAPPDCCNYLGSGGCCWPERKYCLPSQCQAAGVANRCGAAYDPIEPWPLGCYGYNGSPQPTSAPNPTANPNPTAKPNPTTKPSPTIYQQPTQIPYPTQPFYPSTYPTLEPTEEFITTSPPQTNPSPTSSVYQPPLIPTIPNEQVEQPTQTPTTPLIPNPLEIIGNIVGTIFQNRSFNPQVPSPSTPQIVPTTAASINQNAPKTLDLFESMFNTVTNFDKLLQRTIESKINSFFNK